MSAQYVIIIIDRQIQEMSLLHNSQPSHDPDCPQSPTPKSKHDLIFSKILDNQVSILATLDQEYELVESASEMSRKLIGTAFSQFQKGWSILQSIRGNLDLMHGLVGELVKEKKEREVKEKKEREGEGKA